MAANLNLQSFMFVAGFSLKSGLRSTRGAGSSPPLRRPWQPDVFELMRATTRSTRNIVSLNFFGEVLTFKTFGNIGHRGNGGSLNLPAESKIVSQCGFASNQINRIHQLARLLPSI